MNDLQIVALEQMDITTWDFERIKANLESALTVYQNTVYTDDSLRTVGKLIKNNVWLRIQP